MVGTLRTERGQALVEFVIALPLLLALVFLVVYAGVGFHRHLLVTDAARVGARAAAVARFDARDPCDAALDAAQQSVGSLEITVTCVGSGDPGDQYSVTVRHTLDVSLPRLPGLEELETVDLESTATERLE